MLSNLVLRTSNFGFILGLFRCNEVCLRNGTLFQIVLQRSACRLLLKVPGDCHSDNGRHNADENGFS